MVRHLPNLLSLSRIGLGAALYLVLRLDTAAATIASMGLMTLSMLTDYYDGKLARKMKRVSVLGKWIDPLSDFTFFLFVYLSFFRLELMPLPLLIVFLAREVIMYTAVRPISTMRGLDPAAKLPGKLKTVFQNVGAMMILALIAGVQLGLFPRRVLPLVSVPLLSVLVAVSVASVYWYVRPLFPARAGPAANASTMGPVLRLIAGSVIGCYLVQGLYYALVFLLYGLPAARLYLFLAVSAGYHVLLLLALLLVRREFRLERDGSLLVRINPPLVLSFLRFSSIPTVIFLFADREQIVVAHALVPFLAFVFLTDLFDGILARRLHMTTRIGRILDASGDYVLIVVLSVLFVTGGLIPPWLFVLVLVRLLVQALGIIVLYFLRGYSVLRLSFLGKASIFAVFALYGFEILELMSVPVLGWSPLVDVLELVAAAILLSALAEKAVYLVRGYSAHLRHEPEDQPDPGGAAE